MQKDGRALIHAVPDLKEQKEASFTCVQVLAPAIMKQVALKAVAADGTALMFVSENMKQEQGVWWFSPSASRSWGHVVSQIRAVSCCE